MKIPPQAKLVFKGVMFDTYQWEQEMFDGSKETFEMLHRPDTVQIIVTQGNKILIGEESQPTKKPFFTMFGGRVDEGEDSLTAAKRELREEAGLESDEWELLKVDEPYHKMDWHVHLYVARDCKKVDEPTLDAGEKIETLVVDFEKFVEIATGEKFCGKEIAMDLLRQKVAGTLVEFREKIFKK